MRTTPNISSLLDPLENVIRTEFLPCFVKHSIDDNLRDIFALPPKFSGLGIFKPNMICDKEYYSSKTVNAPLVSAVRNQEIANIKLPNNELDTFGKIQQKTKELKKRIAKEKAEHQEYARRYGIAYQGSWLQRSFFVVNYTSSRRIWIHSDQRRVQRCDPSPVQFAGRSFKTLCVWCPQQHSSYTDVRQRWLHPP